MKVFSTLCRINLWNSLLQDVVLATRLDGFKKNWRNVWRRSLSIAVMMTRWKFQTKS